VALQLRLRRVLVEHPVDALAGQLKHHGLHLVRQLKVDAVSKVGELL
jgi:hypothetical protein